MESSGDNFVIRHWRGELPLWVSFWLIGFVAVVLFKIALFTSATIIADELEKALPAQWLFVVPELAVVAWMICAAVFVWIIVGIWRAAEKHKKSHATIWGFFAQLVIIVSAVSFALQSLLFSSDIMEFLSRNPIAVAGVSVVQICRRCFDSGNVRCSPVSDQMAAMA